MAGISEVKATRGLRGTGTGMVRGVPYKRYVLCVLTLVYSTSFLDQNLVILLVEPMKQDLGLSDSQLGFLTGIVFGLLYALLGLPVGRWADRGNRVTIASAALGLWGVAVALCLFVSNFTHLVMARIAASVADSACMPPSYSLLGDYFPGPAQRTRAMTVYMTGSSLASLIAFTAGGVLSERYGWRAAIFVMGIPGLLFAILVKSTVAEPRALAVGSSQVGCRRKVRVTEALAALWRHRSARHLSLAIVLYFMLAAGLAPWYAAFMIRSHGMSTAELGVWLGLIFGVAGVAGTLLGGYVAGRWFADDERGQMRVTALMVALLLPVGGLFLFLPEKLPALLALTLFVIILNFFFGPTFALLQRLVIDEMRATTVAIVMLLANLIGMGFGPQTVGVLSDCLRPVLGSDSLRYAMVLMSSVSLWAAYHFRQAGQTASQDLLAVGLDRHDSAP